MVLHRDGTSALCTDLFCFLSIPIPNSIPGSSTSPFLSLVWDAQLPTYLLARNWATERFSWYTLFFHFSFFCATTTNLDDDDDMVCIGWCACMQSKRS